MDKQAKVADELMQTVFGLTSIHPGSSASGSLDTTKIIPPEGTCLKPDVHPAAQRLSDVTDYKLDQCNLCNNCQMHGCSGYCLYHQKRQDKSKDSTINNNTKKRKFQENVSPDTANDKKKLKRFCRFGAGHEETAGKGDTPGF